MKDSQLLASAALFRELYDSNNDIYDVISEFIKAAVLLNSKWTFNATECTQDLKDIFGFQIPEAVVKTCLRNRLTKAGYFTLSSGTYSATGNLDRTNSIQHELDSTKGEYDEILSDLVSYVHTVYRIDFDEEELKSAFNNYLLNDQISNKFTDYISSFLIKNQSQENFKNKLNRIEEGLVLYEGIKYSSDLSKLGNWDSNLTIFLDTEHLFSAVGLNGILHKQVFDDFNSLVNEVNFNKRKKGSISLRFFIETENEVENFFYAAEKILEKKTQVDPSKTAMISILNGCQSRSEIVTKKAKFFNDLNRLKITKEEHNNYYKEPEYNIESQDLISSLQRQFNHKTENEYYADMLKKFTKINCLREGDSLIGIEHISAIFMTEHRLIQSVAFSDLIRRDRKEIPFATNIEFMTDRFWFKLNKGFSSSNNLPVSFDIISKAKLVLSSQLNNKVFDIYRDLKHQHKEGKISNEDAALLISELRAKPSKPEDFTLDVIDESIDFISSQFIENTLREKSVLVQKSKEGEKAVAKLKKYEYERRVEINKPHKRIARRQYFLLHATTFIFIPLVCFYLLIGEYSSSDTNLSIIWGLAGLISLILAVIKIKKIKKNLWKLSISYYKKHLTS